MSVAKDRGGRRVRLFRNGANQAVRIPREFELPDGEAVMRKEGERLIIEPVPRSLTTAERAALWGDDQGWPLAAPGAEPGGPAVDDRREAIYEPDRGTAAETQG